MSVIDDEVRREVREYAESNMDGRIRVERLAPGGDGEIDPVTLVLTVPPQRSLVYEGKARIPKATGGATISVGEGEIATQQVTFSIPIGDDASVQRDDVVTVLANPADPSMIDGIWRVLGTDAGGAFGEVRHLQSNSWVPSRYWDKEAE